MSLDWTKKLNPDIEATPKFILLREAKLLSVGTEEVLKGSVKSKKNLLKSLFSDGQELITHKFLVSSTSMDYEIIIFEANHEILNTFPVKVNSEYLESAKTAENLDELETIVKEILNLETVTSAITSLYQQSLLMNKQEPE